MNPEPKQPACDIEIVYNGGVRRQYRISPPHLNTHTLWDVYLNGDIQHALGTMEYAMQYVTSEIGYYTMLDTARRQNTPCSLKGIQNEP